jgi:hypothetical protein
MNIGGRLKVWFWLYLLITTGAAQSQVTFNPKIGLETWALKDEKELSGTSKHPAQMVGFGLLLKKENWMFMPGLEYHRISMQNEDHRFGLDFDDAHHAHYFFLPLQAGYTFPVDSSILLSVIAGVDINLFYEMDENDLGLSADQFYGITTALTGSLFAELFRFLTVEVKFHYGLQSILKTRQDARWRGWTLALGYKF